MGPEVKLSSSGLATRAIWLLRDPVNVFTRKSLCGYIVPFLLDIYLKVELLGHLVTLGLFFLKHHSFLTLMHYFKFLQAMSEDSDLFRPSAILVDPSDGKGYLIVLLILFPQWL